MKNQPIVLLGLILFLGFAAARVLLVLHEPDHSAVQSSQINDADGKAVERVDAAAAMPAATPPVVAAPERLAPDPATNPAPRSRSRKTRKAVAKPTPGVAATSTPAPSMKVSTPANEPMIPVPYAREALNYVGVDPYAEEIWIASINDPNISGHDRSDLIEDLNENGFADPHNPTVDELPMIVSRLQLIEELYPDAMDKVNADAFQEAYKDLTNMYFRLAGEYGD